jgi:hypothetical protein
MFLSKHSFLHGHMIYAVTKSTNSFIRSFLKKQNSPVVLVGIGSVESAKKFAEDLDLEKYAGRLTLMADETGAVTEALGCYRGWLTMDQANKERYPQTDVNPYVKLLGMALGFGSPGTIGQVLYGYFGDISDKNGPDGRQWVINSLLQGSEKGRTPQREKEAWDGISPSSSLRPFELATLRFQTGLHILSNWGELGPKDASLCTRMGGTFVFAENKECVWDSFDQGILRYADMEQICEVAGATVKGERYISPRKEARVLMTNGRQDAAIEEVATEEARLEAAEAKEKARIKAQDAVLQAEYEASLKAEEKEKARIKAQDAMLQAEYEAKLKAEEMVRLAEEEARLQAEEEVSSKADEEVRLKDEEEAIMNAVEEARRHEQESLEKAKATLQAEQESKKLLLAKDMSKAGEVERSEEEPAAAKKQPRNTEPFQRKLLEAKIQADLAAKTKATQKPGAKVMTVGAAKTEGEEEPAAAKQQPRNTEPFQRKLLAARIQADLAAKRKATEEPGAKVMTVGAAKIEVEEEPAAAKEQSRYTEAFQRKLLAARIQADLAAKMRATPGSADKVMTVAAAKTKVEEEPAATTQEGGAKISLLEKDSPPGEDVLLSRKKPKKKKNKKTSSPQGFGF